MNSETQNTGENKMTYTVKQINAAVDHFIACASVFENERDKCEFESPEYWDNHDKMINLYEAASNLMPCKK